MKVIAQGLDGKQVLLDYQTKFGSYSRPALKAATLNGAGQALFREMQQATDSGQAMDFGDFVDFVKRMHESMVETSAEQESALV